MLRAILVQKRIFFFVRRNKLERLCNVCGQGKEATHREWQHNLPHSGQTLTQKYLSVTNTLAYFRLIVSDKFKIFLAQGFNGTLLVCLCLILGK
jgi:hypothetical protein